MSHRKPKFTRADLEEVPPSKHVSALLNMAAEDDLHGFVLVDHLIPYYLEACQECGIRPLREQTFLATLARKVEKRRMRVDGRQRSFYRIPRRRK